MTPWDGQAPLSVGFPRQNTGAGYHFLLQGIFPTQGSNLHVLRWQRDSLPLSRPGNPEQLYFLLKRESKTNTSSACLSPGQTYRARVPFPSPLRPRAVLTLMQGLPLHLQSPEDLWKPHMSCEKWHFVRWPEDSSFGLDVCGGIGSDYAFCPSWLENNKQKFGFTRINRQV